MKPYEIALVVFLFTASVGIVASAYYCIKAFKRIENTFSHLESAFILTSEQIKDIALPRISQMSDDIDTAIASTNEALTQVNGRLLRLDRILNDGEISMRSLRSIMVLGERVLGYPLVGVGGLVGGVARGLGTFRRLKRKGPKAE